MNKKYNNDLADILAYTEDAIIGISLDGTIQSWNKGSEKMFGYTSEEMIGKNISLLIPPESSNDDKNHLRERTNTEIFHRYETTRITKNGEQLFVALIAADIKDEAGTIIGSYEVARDITSRKKSENELIQAIKELAFQNEEKEVLVTELLIANKELVFQNEEKYKRAAELSIANEELAFQNAEKEKRAAELLIANKELDFLNKEQTSLFAFIVNSSEDAIVSLTLEGIITSWNYAAEKIFGFKANEIIGKSILAFIPPNFHDEEREILKNIREGKTVDHLITERLRKDGTVFYASISISSARNFKGEIIGASKILRDISDEKRLEQQKNILLTTLEKSLNEIYVFDAETLKFSFVNQGALLNNGYSEQEIKELTPLDIEPEFTVTTFNELVKPLITKEKEKIIFFTNHKRKNGSLYPVEIHLQFVAKGNNKSFLAIILDITERKKADEDLRNAIEKAQESDARFKAYAQQSPIAIYTTDINGDCIYANETWLEIAGMQLEEALGKGWINALHPEDMNYVTDNWYKSIESNGEWNYEYRFLNSNKNIIWVNGRAKKLFNDKNEHIGYLGSNINITERKKVESKLIESENYLRTILDNEPECVKVLNRKGKLVSMNTAGLAMIEADNEQQVLGQRMTNLVNKEYQLGFKQLSNEVFEGKPGRFEFEITGLKGSQRWLETHAVPLKNEKEKIVSLLGVTRDITERKKAEQQLKLYASVVTNTKDAILITEAEPFDEPGPRILYVNEAFTKMTGYTAEDVIGKTPRILQGPKSDRAELKRLGEAIRRWESCEITTINYKKNGEEFWINFTLTPVADEKGWFTHWIAIERDVTAQIKYISTLESQNTKLREIAWSQSHIVRAPLTRMMGIVSMLSDFKMDSSEYEEWVKHFNDSASELEGIIKDIVGNAKTNTLK